MNSTPTTVPISFASLTHTGHYADDCPLGLAMVAAHAKRHFGDQIEVELYKHPVELCRDLDREIPPVMCFSSYVWNFRLSYEISRRIKERAPETVIIFGGPNFPITLDEQEQFMRDHPVIDFFIFREGEYACTDLLERLFAVGLDAGKLQATGVDIGNTFYLNGDGFIAGSARPPIAELDELPSPYLMGICDRLLGDEKLTPLMQFARGCPFKCSFCQEGEEYFNKVRRFPIDRVRAELRYIAERTNSPILQLADSNFGMYKGDLEICYEIAKFQEEFGWPKYVSDFSGKNQKERVLDAVEIIHGSHFLSAAVQSTDENVLKAVKRENVKWDQMIYVAQRGRKLDPNSFAEIILALPADTREAHFRSDSDLIDADLNVVRSHQFIMLLGSSGCTKESRKQFKMDTRFRVMPNTVVPYTLFGETFYMPEIDEICVANSTMSFEDYLECRLYNLTVELFFNNAIFDELYTFLRRSGVQISQLIRNIHAEFRTTAGPLRKIREDFQRETRQLWPDRASLKERLADPAEIEKYLAGELGVNEQVLYRTRAIFQHLDELHRIAFDEAKSLLVANNQYGQLSEAYLGELNDISLLRKMNVLALEESTKRTFHFDFQRLEAERFDADPEDYFDTDGFEIQVGHTDEQKDLINRYTDQYGLSEQSLGYMLSSVANFNKFYRELR